MLNMSEAPSGLILILHAAHVTVPSVTSKLDFLLHFSSWPQPHIFHVTPGQTFHRRNQIPLCFTSSSCFIVCSEVDSRLLAGILEFLHNLDPSNFLSFAMLLSHYSLPCWTSCCCCNMLTMSPLLDDFTWSGIL